MDDVESIWSFIESANLKTVTSLSAQALRWTLAITLYSKPRLLAVPSKPVGLLPRRSLRVTCKKSLLVPITPPHQRQSIGEGGALLVVPGRSSNGVCALVGYVLMSEEGD